jgi:hypothetical protein
MLKLRIIFLCIAIIKIANASFIPVEEENRVSINPKIDFVGVMNGILNNANFNPVSVPLVSSVLATADNKCTIIIRYRNREGSSSLKMNFKSESEDNWNNEIIDLNDDADKTTERVDGGLLKFIENHSVGKFCVQGILYSCGAKLFAPSNTVRSIILDRTTIENAWTKHGHEVKLDYDTYKNCVWFSDRGDRSVHHIIISPEAFTECGNSNESCISDHIQVV